METSLFSQLIGSWKLVNLIEVAVEGGSISHPMGKEPKGLIIYSPDGYMSAQIMNPDRKNFVKEHFTGATPEEYTQEGSTYLAYSGPFEVDEANKTLSHTMYVSLFPNWTGQTQNRIVSFKDGLLHLESGKPFISNGLKVVHKLSWKRVTE
jgi:hypothetical protein